MRIPTVFAGFRKFRKCFSETKKILRSPLSEKPQNLYLYTLSTAITAFSPLMFHSFATA